LEALFDTGRNTFLVAVVNERDREVHKDNHTDNRDHEPVYPHGYALGFRQELDGIWLKVTN
jgi:hypothetical protein